MNKLITISDATEADFDAIIKIAYTTWPETYGKILSDAQISCMLELFYCEKSLQKNVREGQHFLIAHQDRAVVGFAAYQHAYGTPTTTHVNKIYILPNLQGHGIGMRLMEDIESRAIASGAKYLSLNVNRFNDAQKFYSRLGFRIIKEVDIPIAQGYLMEDYVMQKEISRSEAGVL